MRCRQKCAKSICFSSFKNYIWSTKHINRIQLDDIKKAHPKCASSDDCKAELVGSEKNKIVPYIPTEFDRIINAFGLVHLKIKLANPLSHVESENVFIDKECKGAISSNLATQYHTDEILAAMNLHPMACDGDTLLGPDETNEIALNLDDATHQCRSTKIFFGKAWNEGDKTKYVQCTNAKKSIRDVDVNLSDLLT